MEKEKKSLYIRPHFVALDTLLMHKKYFKEYKIKSEGENIFTFIAKEVDGKPLEIALHSQYEGEAISVVRLKALLQRSCDGKLMPLFS